DIATITPPTAAEHQYLDKSAYIAHLLSNVDSNALRPLKLVVNAGNGSASLIVDLLAPHLPFEFARILHEPDGHV
ncbi:phosphomannomutase, partial [Xylella fastidiosa subsp. multiplex]|nr:phosphomannomutase [Xylella fastidiosa subsp. multiplex]